MKNILNFFKSDALIKDSAILLVGTFSIHLLNLIFQIVMGRCLIDQEYALLITLLSIFSILSLPLAVIGTTISRYTSLLVDQRRYGDIKYLIYIWSIRMFFIGLILSLSCFIFADKISFFLNINRNEPIYIFSLIILGIFCRPVFDGALNGLQNFKGWCFSSVLGWSVRLILASFLVLYVSPYANWGLLGHGIGFYIAITVGIIILFNKLKNYKLSSYSLPNINYFMFASFFILFGFSCLMMGDMILIKQIFPAYASDYSYASTLGHIIIFIPQAFVMSMFPKVVSDKDLTQNHKKLFLKTFSITAIITIISALIFSLYVDVLLKIIFNINHPSIAQINWSVLLAWAMVPVALLNVTVRFSLAQKYLYSLMIIPLSAIIFFIFSYQICDSIDDILKLLISISSWTLFLLLVFILRKF